jgi:hypothetical protein
LDCEACCGCACVHDAPSNTHATASRADRYKHIVLLRP